MRWILFVKHARERFGFMTFVCSILARIVFCRINQSMQINLLKNCELREWSQHIVSYCMYNASVFTLNWQVVYIWRKRQNKTSTYICNSAGVLWFSGFKFPRWVVGLHTTIRRRRSLSGAATGKISVVRILSLYEIKVGRDVVNSDVGCVRFTSKVIDGKWMHFVIHALCIVHPQCTVFLPQKSTSTLNAIPNKYSRINFNDPSTTTCIQQINISVNFL